MDFSQEMPIQAPTFLDFETTNANIQAGLYVGQLSQFSGQLDSLIIDTCQPK